jgi:hypothetical protein
VQDLQSTAGCGKYANALHHAATRLTVTEDHGLECNFLHTLQFRACWFASLMLHFSSTQKTLAGFLVNLPRNHSLLEIECFLPPPVRFT